MRQPPFALLIFALAATAWEPRLLIALTGAGAAFLLCAVVYNIASPSRGRV